jgi:hypothetical protein
MKHIIVAGDSFSYYTNELNKTKTPEEIININNGNWFHFLEDEYRQHNIEYKFYYLGRPSAGNHYIIDRTKNKIEELLQKGIEIDSIYCAIQFTYFFRNILSMDTSKMITKELQDDYYDLTNGIPNKLEYIKKTLNDINELANFIKEKNITFNFFFHQSVTKDFSFMKLEFEAELNKIKQYFLTNNDSKLDGMLENYLNKDSDNLYSAYISKYDLHFNPIVYYHWYIDKIKPILMPNTNYKINEDTLHNVHLYHKNKLLNDNK